MTLAINQRVPDETGIWLSNEYCIDKVLGEPHINYTVLILISTNLFLY